MTDPQLGPDAMPDIKYYLKHHPWLADLTAGRVFFHLPKENCPIPFIQMYRTGGGPQVAGDISPMWTFRVSVVVWGNKGQDYPMVRATVVAIESMAAQWLHGTVLGPGGTVGTDMTANSHDLPDNDTGSPRIVMDTSWDCHA